MLDRNDIDPNNAAPLDLAPTKLDSALNTIQRLYALLEKKNAALAVAQAEVALAEAHVRRADADKELHWMQLRDAMAALGCVVPESVPYSASWAARFRAEKDADSALLARCHHYVGAISGARDVPENTRDLLIALQKRVQG